MNQSYKLERALGSTRKRTYIATIGLALLLFLTACTYRVNSEDDAPDADTGDGKCETAAGSCTLRAAVMQSNANFFTYSIEVPNGLFTLKAPLGGLQVTHSVKIQGAGTNKTTIDGRATALLFHVQNPSGGVIPGWCGRMCRETDAIINNLTLQGSAKETQGVIRVEAANTEFNNVIIRAGSAFTGGGGLSVGDTAKVTIRRSSITQNYAKGAFGGGILNRGELWVYDSTIGPDNDSNRAGGIWNGGNMNLRNTTVTGNLAHSGSDDILRRGTGTGGISQNGSAVLHNVTITENTGVGNDPDSGSARGGGIQTAIGKTTVLKNSIIAGNKSRYGTGGIGPKDCVGELSAESKNNLIGDPNGCTIASTVTFATNSFEFNVAHQLGPLANNGGLTETHLPGGPALDKGNSSQPGGPDADACEGRDQRGVPRPQGSGCDLGAVEVTSANAFVIDFILVDAAANTDIRPLLHGDTLILSELPSELSVRATVVGSPGSVVFGYDTAPSFRIENSPPYALGGDSSGNYNPVNFNTGAHTLTATPFAAPQGGGSAGGSHNITFIVRRNPSIGVWDWISGNIPR